MDHVADIQEPEKCKDEKKLSQPKAVDQSHIKASLARGEKQNNMLFSEQ